MSDWHAMAAADIAAEEYAEAASMDDALAAAGVDPRTPTDRLPERGSWALALHLGHGDDDE